ncbi:hypothetical protein DNR41_27420, partial [Escherichia coli]
VAFLFHPKKKKKPLKKLAGGLGGEGNQFFPKKANGARVPLSPFFFQKQKSVPRTGFYFPFLK